MIKKIVILIILLTTFVSMSGCLNQSNNDNVKDLILGTWNRLNFGIDQTWQFQQNGKLIISGSNLNITYHFENNSLFLYYPDLDYLDEYTYQFNGHDELHLTLIPTGDIIIDPNTGKPIQLDSYESIFERIT